jgi:hypothetical protein
MKKYSTEYWLQHYEYAMGDAAKSGMDTSNADWTRANLTRIFNNEFPHGMTGTNITKALIQYVKIHCPDREQEVARLMLEYFESIKTNEAPLLKVRDFIHTIINR